MSGSILLALLASEIDGWAWHLAVWIARKGASRMPAGLDEEYEKVFEGELDAMRDRPLSALVVAFRMFRDSRITGSLVSGVPAGSTMPLRRVADLALASLLLVVMAPLVIAVAMTIRITMGSPVVYRQQRVGRGGARFALAKFRTMVVSDSGDWMVPPIGRWLRWVNLDELPVLWNVVKGDMAMVGPRAELVEVADLRSGNESLDVLPGLAEEWPFWDDRRRRRMLVVVMAVLVVLGSAMLLGAR